MSLFHIQEWFHTNISEASTMVVGQLIEYRDQLIVGSLNGELAIIDPGRDVEKRQEMSVIVESRLNQPILALTLGKFFPNRAEKLVAVLHPKKLAYYRLISENQEMYQIELIFEHKLPGSPAYNMCQGNFGRSPTEQICVQSLNCTLSIYEAENHVFTRQISQSIHPGPLCYSSFSESMISTAGGYLSSTKYNILAAASSTQSGKKMISEWTLNLGDTPVDIAVMGVLPVQPSILVLCKRALFCVTHGGTLRYTIRLQCIALSLMVYNSTADAGIQLLIGTSTKTLLFYHDTTLVWAAQLAFEPIVACLTNFGENYRGFLSCLSDDFRVSVGYLGTEPSLFRMPVTETRYIDFEQRKQEMRKYEENIKNNSKLGGGGEQQTTIGMKVDLRMDSQSLAYDVQDNIPSATIHISITGTSNSVDLIFHGDAFAHQSYLRLSPGELNNVPITIFAKDRPILDHRCQIVAITSNGEVASHELKLPLKLICHEAAAQRNAQFKFSLDATEKALDIGKLFLEFEHENQTSLGLQPFGSDYIVSIFISTKANRYRVQSDSTEFCAVIIEELVRRIRKHQPDVQLKIPVPLHMFMNSILQYLEIEKRRESEEENVQRLSIQMRHVETVLLTKLKSDREDLMPHVNTLVNYSYRELLLALDRLVAIEGQVSPQGRRGLRSLLNLFSIIMNLVEMDLPFDGRILDGTDQKLAERIFAVLSSPGDEPFVITPEVAEVGRKLVGFCERGGNLAEIAEEDEEEEENENPEESTNGFEFAGLQTGAMPADLGLNHLD